MSVVLKANPIRTGMIQEQPFEHANLLFEEMGDFSSDFWCGRVASLRMCRACSYTGSLCFVLSLWRRSSVVVAQFSL